MIKQVHHAPLHLIGFDRFILPLQSLKIPSLLHDILLQFAIFRIRFTSLPQTWGHFRQQTVLPPRKSRPSEEYIVLKGNYSRLAWLHLRLQVRLVADEEDHSVGVGQVARVCQPGGKVVVSRPVNKIILGNIFFNLISNEAVIVCERNALTPSCDIIDKESPCGTSVVGPRHSSEP